MYCTLFASILLNSKNPVDILILITILTIIFGPGGLLIVSGTKVIKSHPPLVASEAKHVGISPLDYFTWGHLAFGVLSFLVDFIFIVMLAIEYTFLLVWSIVLTLILIAITWEIVENILFIEMGIKFENRRDSPINAFSDVFFVIIGGLLIFIIHLILGRSVYITAIAGIVILAVFGLLFIIRNRMVAHKKT
jgi:hypothetical protein